MTSQEGEVAVRRSHLVEVLRILPNGFSPFNLSQCELSRLPTCLVTDGPERALTDEDG